MKYNYRNGDRVFFKVMVGMAQVPLEKDEVQKLANALREGQEGMMVFRMGIVRLDKINGIVPDYDRMEDWNVNGQKIELPDVGKLMLVETPQDLDMPRIGEARSLKEIASKKI